MQDGRIDGESSIAPCTSAASGSAHRGSRCRRARLPSSSIPDAPSERVRTPTTRACIELLAEIRRGSLLDAGCGSGVVAVAAARLGFDPVVAVDSDPVAVEVARDTVRRNAARVAVHPADVLRGELPDADVMVANIELAVVDALLARRAARTIVTSGYLAGETPHGDGWEIVRDLEVEGWAAHVLVPTDRTAAL
jgi:SAM-dependent methyltransferase